MSTLLFCFFFMYSKNTNCSNTEYSVLIEILIILKNHGKHFMKRKIVLFFFRIKPTFMTKLKKPIWICWIVFLKKNRNSPAKHHHQHTQVLYLQNRLIKTLRHSAYHHPLRKIVRHTKTSPVDKKILLQNPTKKLKQRIR